MSTQIGITQGLYSSQISISKGVGFQEIAHQRLVGDGLNGYANATYKIKSYALKP
ncbi:MAG: hypothetical protein MUF71_06795 [Candidatus Kapabacteria bacterium]|nr:hypothetical protein [Candidatus Kapabacteria bacterium]